MNRRDSRRGQKNVRRGNAGMSLRRTMAADPRAAALVFVVSLLIWLSGSLLADYIQTGGGSVAVRDVRFAGANGTIMSALLYIPKTATDKTPAPGILAVHGYVNSRETQDGFAIEFSRRGYVVLALDQTGHGYSDPPAFANGFGGPDGLAYLRSLPFVDKNNIGMEGHSMGGWAILAAAKAFPNDYQSLVLEGSSTGSGFAAEGDPTWPRNLGLVYSKFDEFSELMWEAPTGRTAPDQPKMQKVFGANGPVQVGKLYGSIAEGTARLLYQPATTHPGDHWSDEAIGDAIDWFQQTLQGGRPLPASNQTWRWKEIGTLLALLGAVVSVFPMGALLLRTGYFNELEGPMPESKAVSGTGWIISAIIAAIIPAVTFFPLQDLANTIPVSAVFPQTITNGVMYWALGDALICLALFLVWYFTTARKNNARGYNVGVSWHGGIDWGMVWRSLVLAFALMAWLYTLLELSDFFFKVDFRIWVLAIKLFDPILFRIFLGYVVPFAIYFLIVALILNGQLRRDASLGWAMVINSLMLMGGIILLLLIQYIPLLSGSPLPLGQPLLTIVGFQFIPLLTIAACLVTYFFRKTGHIYTGAFLSALLISWFIIASQATQFAVH